MVGLEKNEKSNFGDVIDHKPAWYAAINGVRYAATIDPIDCPKCRMHIITYHANNYGEMAPLSVLLDNKKIEDKVRNYLKKLDGLNLTIPILDIARDLGMTEEAVIKILQSWDMELEDTEYQGD